MSSMMIGAAARAAGVSTKAIRFWEDQGLLPQVERSVAGYRTFDDAGLARLRFIRQAKSLGLTLQEIRDVLQLVQAGESPCCHVTELLDRHLAAIDESIADLNRLRQPLVRARAAATASQFQEGGDVFCHIIEDAI